MTHRILITALGGLISLIGGLMISAQILGFVGAYHALPVLLLSVVMTCLFAWLYFRRDYGWHARVFSTPRPISSQLHAALIMTALTLLAGVFLLRIALFPTSDAGLLIPADAINYHFVKAYELIRTAGYQDLTLPYGQYPIGYESLASFSLLVTGGWRLFGVLNAGLMLALVLAIYALIRRYSTLPVGVALLLSALLFAVPDLYSMALQVGKNDLTLSLTLLLAVVYAPVGWRRDDRSAHPYALAIMTMISLGTKASGFFLLAAVWLWVLIVWWQAYRQGQAGRTLTLLDFVACIALMFPGGLWVIRNYALMGAVFSPEISGFFGGSIAANLTHPLLLSSGYESVLLVGYTLTLIVLVMVLITRQKMILAAILMIMWAAFFVTPLSAFHTTQKTVLHIEWRYVIHAFMLAYVILLTLGQSVVLRVVKEVERWPLVFGVMGVMGAFGVLVVLDIPAKLTIPPEQQSLFIDPYTIDADTAEYANVYDFVRREIKQSNVYYDTITRFYLYTPDLTNRFSDGSHPLGNPLSVEQMIPDVMVFGRIEGIRYSVWKWLLSDLNWRVVYDDGIARVYQYQPPT